jgi:hypothetical protein
MDVAGQRSHALALFVAPNGDRWEVRISPTFDAAFAYGTADAALDVARSAARSHWEKWGFACAVYARDHDADAWRLEARFDAADEAGRAGADGQTAHGMQTVPGE